MATTAVAITKKVTRGPRWVKAPRTTMSTSKPRQGLWRMRGRRHSTSHPGPASTMDWPRTRPTIRRSVLLRRTYGRPRSEIQMAMSSHSESPEPKSEQSQTLLRKSAPGASSIMESWSRIHRTRTTQMHYNCKDGPWKMLPRKLVFPKKVWMITCYSWDLERNMASILNQTETRKLVSFAASWRKRRNKTRRPKARKASESELPA